MAANNKGPPPVKIPVSLVAALIGKNPYKSTKDAAHTILHQTPTYMNPEHIKLDQVVVDAIERAGSIDPQKLASMMPDFSEEEVKRRVSEYCVQRGVLEEKNILDTFADVYGVKLYAARNRIKDIRSPDLPVPLRLSGRADSVFWSKNECVIVEAKCRMEKFFLPEYEVVQCQLYMFLYNCEKCVHVQYLNGELHYSFLFRDEVAVKTYLNGLVEAMKPILLSAGEKAAANVL